jgi:hypothetical protein
MNLKSAIARHLSSIRLGRYVNNLPRWMNKIWRTPALFGATRWVTPMCSISRLNKKYRSKEPHSTAFLRMSLTNEAPHLKRHIILRIMPSGTPLIGRFIAWPCMLLAVLSFGMSSLFAAEKTLPALPPVYQPEPLLPQPHLEQTLDPVQMAIDSRLLEIDRKLAEIQQQHEGREPVIAVERLDPGPIPEREQRDMSWRDLQSALRQAAFERPAAVVDDIAQPPSPAADRFVHEVYLRNRLGLAMAWQGMLRSRPEEQELAQRALDNLGQMPVEEVPADEQLRWRYLRAWFHAALYQRGPVENRAFHQEQIAALAEQMTNRAPSAPLTLTVQEIAAELP